MSEQPPSGESQDANATQASTPGGGPNPPDAANAENPSVPPGSGVGASTHHPTAESTVLSGTEIGAIAHLFRAEVYRSTTWRTRLDATTNWSVVSLGVALSVTYADPSASALPLVFVGALIFLFLLLEARRYRYFNVWRARARWLETHFYAPMLTGAPYQVADSWGPELAEDYRHPDYHISYWRAIGRRLRRNYLWVFYVQGFAYYGKAIIHPLPAPSPHMFFERLAIGPIDGISVWAIGVVFYTTLSAFTLFTWRRDRRKHGGARSKTTIG